MDCSESYSWMARPSCSRALTHHKRADRKPGPTENQGRQKTRADRKPGPTENQGRQKTRADRKPGPTEYLSRRFSFLHYKDIISSSFYANDDVCGTTFLVHKEELPILCSISHILAIAIEDNAIKVDGYTYAEPFFTTNRRDLTKAMLVDWKPEKFKTPVFRQAVRTTDGLTTSKHKALHCSTFAFYLDRLG